MVKLTQKNTISFCFLLFIGTPANATAAEHVLDYNLYGQVNRAVSVVDNGNKSDVGFVDNSGSNSRFGVTGSLQVQEQLKLGFNYEVGLNENPSEDWDVYNNGNHDSFDLNTRIASIWLQGPWGQVAFGKLETASDGAIENDYSGTQDMGGGVGYIDYAESLSFVDGQGRRVARVGDLADDFNGLDRLNGMRYDSPTAAGFSVSAGVYSAKAFDIAPSFEIEFGEGGQFVISANYADSQDLDNKTQPDGTRISDNQRFKDYGGSTALLLSSGINFTLAYKHRSYSASDALANHHSADHYFAGIGYRLNKHNMQLNYAQVRGYGHKHSKLEQIGAAYVYNWFKYVDLFASYHRYIAQKTNRFYDGTSGQEPGAEGQWTPVRAGNVKKIDQIFTGIRVKFF